MPLHLCRGGFLMAVRKMIAVLALLVASERLAFSGDLDSGSLGLPVNHYAGRRLELRPSGLPPSASLRWRVVASGGALASGTALSGADGSASLSLDLPPLKDGAALKAELLLSFDGAPDLKAPLLLHSAKVFAEGAALKVSSIGVWSPDDSAGAKLARLLEGQGLKPEVLDSPDSFKGDALLASGLDFDESPKAFERLLALASRGVEVVVLPPLKGSVALKPALFSSMLLEKGLPLSSLYPDFCSADLGALPSAAVFSLGAEPSSLDLKPGKGASPDSFRFCRLNAGKGSLVIIGWSFAALSEASPAPLLVLKGLIDEKNSNSKRKDR